MENRKVGCGTLILIIVGIMYLISSCSGSNRSSSYRYTSPRDRYDAKYGQGEYDKDTQMMKEIKDKWDSWTDGK